MFRQSYVGLLWSEPVDTTQDADAQSNLGFTYRNGQGVPKDYVQAHRWLNLGAASGMQEAAKYRDLIAIRMTLSQIAEAQKLAASGQVGEQVTGWLALSSDDV